MTELKKVGPRGGPVKYVKQKFQRFMDIGRNYDPDAVQKPRPWRYQESAFQLGKKTGRRRRAVRAEKEMKRIAMILVYGGSKPHE
jgi:hypothetical protein